MFGVNLLLPLFTFARWAFLRTHSFRATLLDALPLRGFVFLFWFCSLLATRSLSSHLAPRVLLPCRLNIYIYILIDCQCVVWDSDLFWLIEELYFLTFLRYLVNSLTWTKQQLCDLVWNSHLWIFRFKGGWGGFPAKLQDVEFLMVGAVRRGQTAFQSPVQLQPILQPVFPWCAVSSAFLVGGLSATIGIFIWLLTLDWRLPIDCYRLQNSTIFFCIFTVSAFHYHCRFLQRGWQNKRQRWWILTRLLKLMWMTCKVPISLMDMTCNRGHT